MPSIWGVDIIAAAFLGLIFLGETINYLHFIALFLSAVGAIFISQPEFLFGSKGHENHLGSLLALLSGFFQAASFICARKSQHISVAVLTFFSLFLAVFMSLLPPLLPMIHSATGWWWRIWVWMRSILIHEKGMAELELQPISGKTASRFGFTTWLSNFPSNLWWRCWLTTISFNLRPWRVEDVWSYEASTWGKLAASGGRTTESSRFATDPLTVEHSIHCSASCRGDQMSSCCECDCDYFLLHGFRQGRTGKWMWLCEIYVDCVFMYPPVSRHGNWNSSINASFIGTVNVEWRIFGGLIAIG